MIYGVVLLSRSEASYWPVCHQSLTCKSTAWYQYDTMFHDDHSAISFDCFQVCSHFWHGWISEIYRCWLSKLNEDLWYFFRFHQTPVLLARPRRAVGRPFDDRRRRNGGADLRVGRPGRTGRRLGVAGVADRSSFGLPTRTVLRWGRFGPSTLPRRPDHAPAVARPGPPPPPIAQGFPFHHFNCLLILILWYVLLSDCFLRYVLFYLKDSIRFQCLFYQIYVYWSWFGPIVRFTFDAVTIDKLINFFLLLG